MRTDAIAWTLRSLALAVCASAIAGCGSAKPRPMRPIKLSVTSPSTVTATSATVTGTVVPAGATVLVLGHTVHVHKGSFSTQVALAPGTNIIDVLAGSPHARDAMQAVRVFRRVVVTVPALSGESPSDAQQRLSQLGLVGEVSKDDPFYSFLIPGSDSVCGTDPAAGAKVAPGSKVKVTVSKTC